MNYFIFLFLIELYSVSGESVHTLLFKKQQIEIGKEPYCFKFSWIGPVSGTEKNCSDPMMKNIPCIKPFEASPALPNFPELWKNSKETHGCILRLGFSCMKYTYKFNNAIVNASFFCGKMVQDTINVVEKGCFNQEVGGYEVETCACRSKGLEGEIPCNSSYKNYFSLLNIILMTLIFYLMHNVSQHILFSDFTIIVSPYTY